MQGVLPEAGHALTRATTWVADHEPWLVLLAVPPLLLPEFLAPLLPAAGAFLLFLLASRVATRRTLRCGGRLDLALLILLIMLPVSLWASSDPGRSFPKLTTTIAGMFLFWSLGTGLRERADLRAGSIILALSGAGLAVAGFIGTDWPSSKVLYLSGIYDRLPRLMLNLPRATRGRFDPNEVAGALVMLIPVVLAMLLAVWTRPRDDSPISVASMLPGKHWPAILKRPGLLVAALTLTLAAMLFVFLLTQSRGALVALSIAILVCFVLRDRRVMLAVLAVIIIGFAWDASAGPHAAEHVTSALITAHGSLADRLSAALEAANSVARVGSGSTATATGRVEMWRNALQAISDYPLTGIGFHTFPAVSWANYVYTTVSPAWNMTHAHNAYLQAGVDFGVAGLLAFLLLVGSLIYRGLRLLVQRPPAFEQWLACGVLGGLAGHLAHSMVDVAGRPLGDKPGIIFWAMTGLLVAACRLQMDEASASALPAKPVNKQAVIAALLLLVAGAWAFTAGPLLPITRLDLGALALDQARLRSGLSDGERVALLDRAQNMLNGALPWKADTVNLRLGLLMNERGLADQAQQYWAKTPLAFPFLLAQGDAQWTLGHVGPARAYFLDAAAIDPGSSRAQYRLGTIAARERRPDDALSAFRNAIALDNYDGALVEKSRTYAGIGSILSGQKHWAEAVDAFQQAQAISPSFGAQAELARALYSRDGNAQAAEAYLRSAMRTTPGQIEPYLGLIDILEADERPDEALAVARDASNRFPDYTQPLMALGRLDMQRQAYAEARVMFRRALVIRPKLVDAQEWLGRLALAQQKPAEAIAAFNEAIQLAPDQAGYYILLGDAQRMAGQLSEAGASYRRALEIDPGNAQAERALEGLSK
jgi:tetratricopeptide (TPR) repeat protein